MTQGRSNLSLYKGVRRGLLLKFRARDLSEYEYLCKFSVEKSELAIRIFRQRYLLKIELSIRSEDAISVGQVRYIHNQDAEVALSQVSVEEYQDMRALSILPVKVVPVSQVNISLDGVTKPFGYQLKLVAKDQECEDYLLLKNAVELAGVGDSESAISSLHRYEEYSDENPHAAYFLAQLYHREKNLEKSSEYALRAITNGLIEQGVETYRMIHHKPCEPPVEQIRALQSQSARWRVDDSVGMVVLQKRDCYDLAYGDFYLRTSRAVIQIRRWAAARLLRTLQFTFTENKEVPLYTHVHVVHANGNVEQVPFDNFSVIDSQQGNIFITVEAEKEGNWILPDLQPGDLIAWDYQLLGRMQRIAGENQFFSVHTPFDSQEPTYHAQTQFLVPKGLRVRFSTTDQSHCLEYRETHGNTRTVHQFDGHAYVPIKNTGFEYEDKHLNPTISCSSGDYTWQDVSKQIFRTSLGIDNRDSDRLPQPLSDAVDKAPHKSQALENAFYWIRDKLKYASLRSTNAQVGQSDRANFIVRSGTADCKDRAYLLALVCNHLNMPCQCLLVSAKNGVIAEDLPADQFDHVFLRVKLEDDWIYLDPTSSQTPFATAPPMYQGMRALVLDGRGTIITIPQDRPERNLLEIHEVLERAQDNWLEGTFDFIAHGHNSRLINEFWKSMSLRIRNQHQAAQQVLRNYLPSSLLLEFEKVADPATSSLFWVRGRYKRCHLFSMGEHDDDFALIRWHIPSLPLQYWRVLQIERMFVFNFPLTIRFEVRLDRAIVHGLRDYSMIHSIDNPICSIEAASDKRDGAMTIRRTIQIKQKFVREEHLHLLPDSLEQIENSTQLVISLHR